MSRIGKPLRKIDVQPQPKRTPAPRREPAPAKPKKAPERKPEKVPA